MDQREIELLPFRADQQCFTRMSDEQAAIWSLAHNPYAIAVSQSWWAIQALLLFASKARSALGHEQQIAVTFRILR